MKLKKPIWKKPLPEMALGDGRGSYLACPDCGEFLSVPTEVIGGTMMCNHCGELLDMNDAFDEILSSVSENCNKEQELC